jgi:hypothetical protein
MTHDGKRTGTIALFTTLNVLDGHVTAQCQQRHRRTRFPADLIAAAYPNRCWLGPAPHQVVGRMSWQSAPNLQQHRAAYDSSRLSIETRSNRTSERLYFDPFLILPVSYLPLASGYGFGIVPPVQGRGSRKVSHPHRVYCIHTPHGSNGVDLGPSELARK